MERLSITINLMERPDLKSYMPDFLVKLKNETTVILEVKGFEDEQARTKHEAAKRWCDALSYWREMGKWKFDVCKDPKNLKNIL